MGVVSQLELQIHEVLRAIRHIWTFTSVLLAIPTVAVIVLCARRISKQYSMLIAIIDVRMIEDGWPFERYHLFVICNIQMQKRWHRQCISVISCVQWHHSWISSGSDYLIAGDLHSPVIFIITKCICQLFQRSSTNSHIRRSEPIHGMHSFQSISYFLNFIFRKSGWACSLKVFRSFSNASWSGIRQKNSKSSDL